MLSLLHYHHRTTDHFKQHVKAWEFFANREQKEEKLQAFKNDLLKNTYKFDTVTDAPLYEKANFAAEKLGLKTPIYLYQAQNTDEMNATIVYLKNEAHIVFSGRILELLDDEEKQAIIAHELSHVQLYTQLDGQVEVADRMITAIANHAGSTPAHYETARLFKLYTEIFCDRGAYLVTGNYAPIISSLVKIATGLQKINVESYIKQAEEIFSADSTTKAAGVSHPENFIRARAIWLWHSQGSTSESLIEQMIEGSTNFEELDLFKQQQISRLTHQLVLLLLHRDWMRTDQMLSLAKQYFGEMNISDQPNKSQLISQMSLLHSNLQDYFAYVLYDFATADKTLEDVPLGYCFYLADELKIDNAFVGAVKKERKLTEKKVSVLKKQLLAEFHQHSIPAVSSPI